MKAETIRKKLKSKYKEITLGNLVELLNQEQRLSSNTPVLYFKVVLDSEYSITTHESLENHE